MSKSRLETLTDGVFAIVMTLLVLELLDVRVTEAKTATELNQALLALWPKVVSYIISFAVVGVFWIGHHTEFRYITRTNHRHLWINILFLFTISVLPFSAALLGLHYHYQLPVVIYGLNMIAASLALYLNWWYATSHDRLISPDLDAGIRASIVRRVLIGPSIYLIAIVLSFWSPPLSFVIFVITAAFYVVSQLFPVRDASQLLTDSPDELSEQH
jgi:uncharacterized membrane protein